jgi:hypothetical protein
MEAPPRRNLAEFLLFPIPQDKHRSLSLAKALDCLPILPYTLTGEDALFERSRAIGEPLSNLRKVRRMCSCLSPELGSSVALVVRLQVDGNAHQKGHRARFAAKAEPVAMRPEKALLSQSFSEVRIAQR